MTPLLVYIWLNIDLCTAQVDTSVKMHDQP